MNNRPIDPVLSGGRINGAAHSGVIKLIEEKKVSAIYISWICVGAIVGAMYVTGHLEDTILEFF
jgi:NTE family protein